MVSSSPQSTSSWLLLQSLNLLAALGHTWSLVVQKVSLLSACLSLLALLSLKDTFTTRPCSTAWRWETPCGGTQCPALIWHLLRPVSRSVHVAWTLFEPFIQASEPLTPELRLVLHDRSHGIVTFGSLYMCSHDFNKAVTCINETFFSWLVTFKLFIYSMTLLVQYFPTPNLLISAVLFAK